MIIKQIKALEILSSVGRPTIQATVILDNGVQGVASVPIGTSKGKHEAKELYDGGSRYRGYGVRKAVNNINEYIAPKLIGRQIVRQWEIDKFLIELDGTEDKRNLGSNAILAVSLAVARAGAKSVGLPLYRYIGGLGANRLPMPLATVIAGGEYSPSPLDFEDYLLVLSGFETFADAVEGLVETRYCLGEMLKERFEIVPSIGGGAYAPLINDTEAAFDIMLGAIEKAGFSKKILLGLDVAGSELYNEDNGCYKVKGGEITTEELTEYYRDLARQYPLVFIEDPFQEDDFDSSSRLTSILPQIQIVGDDLFVTNPARIREGIEKKACNTILLKVNQIGTLSEACDAAFLATSNNYAITVSMRSSDTNDSFIADLAVGLGALQIKLGSPVSGERNAKYNRLLEIEQELGSEAKFAGKNYVINSL